MRVWVRRELCQGAELCVEASGAVFATDDDYVSFVKIADGAEPADDAGRAVTVPSEHEDSVRLAARECPSQCIRVVE